MADKLEALKAEAVKARILELEIADLEERLQQKQEQLTKLYRSTLPDMMEEAGVDTIGVPPSGNLPGTDYEIKPYYSANIAASWDPGKREDAFSVLKKYKAESLIKTEVKSNFGKGQMAAAKKLITAAKKLKAAVSIKQSVHPGTLSAWLREIYSSGKALPASDLEKIGALVGRYVAPKERKED